MDYFCYPKEAIIILCMCNHHFNISKDKWNTKEDTGKSMKNVLPTLWYAKRYHIPLKLK